MPDSNIMAGITGLIAAIGAAVKGIVLAAKIKESVKKNEDRIEVVNSETKTLVAGTRKDLFSNREELGMKISGLSKDISNKLDRIQSENENKYISTKLCDAKQVTTNQALATMGEKIDEIKATQDKMKNGQEEMMKAMFALGADVRTVITARQLPPLSLGD